MILVQEKSRQRIVQSFLWIGLVWLMMYPLLGGFGAIKSLLQSLSYTLFGDKKAGVPILCLSLPILLPSICAMYVWGITANNKRHRSRKRTTPTNKRQRKLSTICSVMSYTRFTYLFVILPSCIYGLAAMYRHLDNDLQTALKGLGNSLGMMALVVMSWLLVPASTIGPMTTLLPVHVMQVVSILHAWSGRLVVLASLGHGAFHIARWIYLKESLVSLTVVPPLLGSCFMTWMGGETENDDDLTMRLSSLCHSEHTTCTCYSLVRNATGFWAGICLLLVGITSHYTRRQSNYRLFLIVHYGMTPLIYLLVILHYNKALLYLSGGLLYYMAMHLPRWIESRQRRTLTILSVERLESHPPGRPCLSITIHATPLATTTLYQSGQFVYLHLAQQQQCIKPAFKLSLAHPFTINRVPDQPHQLRLICRVGAGTFTRELKQRLVGFPSATTTTAASLHVASQQHGLSMQGYYGIGHDATALLDRHDALVFVAAGVGITPYLSILLDLVTPPHHPSSTASCSIHLHWICRDASLIQHVEQEYFQPLQRKVRETHRMTASSVNITVYHTASSANGVDEGGSSSSGIATAGTSYRDDPNNRIPSLPQEKPPSTPDFNPSTTQALDDNPVGDAWEPSRFSLQTFDRRRILLIATNFAVMSGLGLAFIWFCYQNIQHKHEVWGRAVAMGVLLGLCFAIAFVSNLIMRRLPLPRRPDATNSSTDLHNGLLGGRLLSPAENEDVFQDEPGSYEDNSSSTDDNDDDGTIELTSLREKSAESASTTPRSTRPKETCMYVQKHGRPDIQDLLHATSGVAAPAVFLCVPTTLSEKIQQALCKTKQNIPVYEESFEL